MSNDLYEKRFFTETIESTTKVSELDKTKYLVQNYEIYTDVYDTDFEIFKLEIVLRQGIYVLEISFRDTISETLIDVMENGTCVRMEEDPLSVIEPDVQTPFDCLIRTNVKGIKYYDQYIPFNIEKNDFIIKNGSRSLQRSIIFDIVKRRIESIIDANICKKEGFELLC